MSTLGPEFSPLVRRYAIHMANRTLDERAVLLTAFERELKDEIRSRCEGTGNDPEVLKCEGKE